MRVLSFQSPVYGGGWPFCQKRSGGGKLSLARCSFLDKLFVRLKYPSSDPTLMRRPTSLKNWEGKDKIMEGA